MTRTAWRVVLTLVAGATSTITACDSSSSKQVDTRVTAYFAAKDSLRREGRRRHISGTDDPFYLSATKDLENRLRAIIGQDSIGGAPLRYNASLYAGEDGDGLDGLAGRAGDVEVVITTPALAVSWIRARGDSVSAPLVALGTEDMLTWAFGVDMHVYPFADIKAKAALPSEIFLAQMIGLGNDDPPYADKTLVGVERDGRIYLIVAPSASPSINMQAQCGQHYRDEYRPCFDRHLAGHADLPKVVAQVKELANLHFDSPAGPGQQPAIPGDVASYYDAKRSYVTAYEVAQDSSRPIATSARNAMGDLEARLNAIIGPVEIPGRTKWVPTFEYIPVRGNEGGDELDGLKTHVGEAEVVVSTPELAAEWMKWHHTPFEDYRKAFNTEDWLTHTLSSEAHVYSFGDILPKASLPSEVFLAQVFARAQDTGSPVPDAIMIGVARGAHFFLVQAPLEVSIKPPAECGSPYSDSYRGCYGAHLTDHPDFPKIVAQAKELVKLVPP